MKDKNAIAVAEAARLMRKGWEPVCVIDQLVREFGLSEREALGAIRQMLRESGIASAVVLTPLVLP
jgi:hypothetical protein